MNVMNNLPDGVGCVVVLSGGLDSTTAMRFCVEKYGAKNVSALTFNYGQKQAVEIEKAKASTALLGVKHMVIDASFLRDISMGYSANVDPNIAMPTIQEVLGSPTPPTYVPNRNMILMSIAAAYAEVNGVEYIVTGVQSTDEYGYWDTTRTWVDKMNSVFAENRKIKPKLVAPFVNLSKKDEVHLLLELDGNLDLLKNTITCYNPNSKGESCAECPSCAERIAAFMHNKQQDVIPYSKVVNWRV